MVQAECNEIDEKGRGSIFYLKVDLNVRILILVFSISFYIITTTSTFCRQLPVLLPVSLPEQENEQVLWGGTKL